MLLYQAENSPLHNVSELLRTIRHERGSIDFDFDESKITVDEDGQAAKRQTVFSLVQ